MSVVTADTIQMQTVDSQYGDRLHYRFMALRGRMILDVVELAADEWSVAEAIDYVRKDRWIAANRAEFVRLTQG